MTSQPSLSPETTTIQRVLFIAPKVHIYQIPPLTSNKGYTASTWTANNNQREIFTGRLRILETASSVAPSSSSPEDDDIVTVKTDILLEDPNTGELFAAAPYTSQAVVEQALDSSRFFAVRVQDESGRKAVLGLGFEDRSEAVDFGICLQEARKVNDGGKAVTGGHLQHGRKEKVGGGSWPGDEMMKKRDFSLKPGETITVSLGGGKGTRRRRDGEGDSSTPAIPPPSYADDDGDGQLPFLPPPPPSAKDRRDEKRRNRQSMNVEDSVVDTQGFDDGEFGEFQ